MRALVIAGLVGVAFLVAALDVIAQDNSEPQMTTSCLVDNTSWRPGKEFVVQAKRQIVDPWYYDNEDEKVEITYSFKQIASQAVPRTGDDSETYDYKFTADDGEEVVCSAEFKRKRSGSSAQIKFIKAYCRGDRPYECDKNYNDGQNRFRVRFTIGR